LNGVFICSWRLEIEDKQRQGTGNILLVAIAIDGSEHLLALFSRESVAFSVLFPQESDQLE